MTTKTIGLVIGTRPEAIKLGPLYCALTRRGHRPIVLLSGQHGEILDPILRLFGIEQARVLDFPYKVGSLLDFAGHALVACSDALDETWDALVVQGDTTTAMVASIASFYRKIPVAHVEAGLRTLDVRAPFPEEFNRRVITRAATWHFAPTLIAAANLRDEGITENIYTVGNTVVDAALQTGALKETTEKLWKTFPFLKDNPFVVVTAHRRESFGKPLRDIAQAVRALAQEWRELYFLVPLHPNPNAAAPMKHALQDQPNVRLTPPVEYDLMIGLLQHAWLVLTDSGGLQEEAPSFDVPVLVLRKTTERPEGIVAGCSVLVGTDTQSIIREFNRLRTDDDAYRARAGVPNPYGDGLTADRIADILLRNVQ